MVPPKPDPSRKGDCTEPLPLFTEGFIKGGVWTIGIVVPFIILWTFFFTALSVNSIRNSVYSMQRDIDNLEHIIKEGKQK